MLWGKKMPDEVKPEDIEIREFNDEGVIYLKAVDVAYFMSVTEDAELNSGSPGAGRRWNMSERDAIATVLGKIRSKILGKAAGK